MHGEAATIACQRGVTFNLESTCRRKVVGRSQWVQPPDSQVLSRTTREFDNGGRNHCDAQGPSLPPQAETVKGSR